MPKRTDCLSRMEWAVGGEGDRGGVEGAPKIVRLLVSLPREAALPGDQHTQITIIRRPRALRLGSFFIGGPVFIFFHSTAACCCIQLRLAGPRPPFLTSCRENDGPCPPWPGPGPCPCPPERLAGPYMPPPPPLLDPATRAARPPAPPPTLAPPLLPPTALAAPPERLSWEISLASALGSCCRGCKGGGRVDGGPNAELMGLLGVEER